MRALLIGAVAVVVGALTGCGGDAAHRDARSYAAGADQVWVFRPAQKPRAVVVFVHGHGGPGEDTPMYHRAWLRHLAATGVAALYPRYELAPGGHETVGHIENAVRTGMDALGEPEVPLVGIGYSRGGRLVMAWAAQATGTRVAPRALLSVVPASGEDPKADLTRISTRTPIRFQVGDHDEVVGDLGARDLVGDLGGGGATLPNLGVELVRSHGSFVASHLSVLENTPGARKAFWRRADSLIDVVAPRG